MKGLFCLCLLSLLFFSFVGCEKEEPQTADTSSVVSDFLDDSELDNAYQIVKDVVVLNPKADGGVVMEIAHNTTVQELFTAVVADEGYELAVVDEKGNKLTPSQTITSGMTFNVYQQGSQEYLFSYVFQTVDASVIAEFYKNQKQ